MAHIIRELFKWKLLLEFEGLPFVRDNERRLKFISHYVFYANKGIEEVSDCISEEKKWVYLGMNSAKGIYWMGSL